MFCNNTKSPANKMINFCQWVSLNPPGKTRVKAYTITAREPSIYDPWHQKQCHFSLHLHLKRPIQKCLWISKQDYATFKVFINASPLESRIRTHTFRVFPPANVCLVLYLHGQTTKGLDEHLKCKTKIELFYFWAFFLTALTSEAYLIV